MFAFKLGNMSVGSAQHMQSWTSQPRPAQPPTPCTRRLPREALPDTSRGFLGPWGENTLQAARSGLDRKGQSCLSLQGWILRNMRYTQKYKAFSLSSSSLSSCLHSTALQPSGGFGGAGLCPSVLGGGPRHQQDRHHSCTQDHPPQHALDPTGELHRGAGAASVLVS